MNRGYIWKGPVALLVFLIILISMGCDDGSSDNLATGISEISVQGAMAILDETIVAATSHNLDDLCSIGGSVSMCRWAWQEAGEWTLVPVEPPELTATYTVPNKEYDNGSWAGGRVLVLEGLNGRGEHYRTEFLVFFDHDSEKFVALNPVYWSGTSIAFPDEEGRIITTPSPSS